MAGSEYNPTLVLGAGELGMAVLRALSEPAVRDGKSTLSVLLRPSAGADSAQDGRDEHLRSLGVEVIRADIAAESEDALAAIFARYATVVSCTGFVGGPGTQRKLAAAILKARVARYVPWQFGVDYDAVGRGSGQDVWDEQLDVRAMLRSQSATRWLIVSTGMFTSFLFEPAFGVVDLAKARVHALGRWNNRLTTTTPDDIGRLTAAILAHEPRINDTVVYVAGDTFTYGDLADTVEKTLGRPVERALWDAETLRSRLAAHPNDLMAKYHLAFARDAGVAWDKDRTFNGAFDLPVTDMPTWLAHRLREGASV